MKVKDPVCGMEIDDQGAASATHRETTYYFCCEACQQKFAKDPESYLQGQSGEEHHGHHH